MGIYFRTLEQGSPSLYKQEHLIISLNYSRFRALCVTNIALLYFFHYISHSQIILIPTESRDQVCLVHHSLPRTYNAQQITLTPLNYLVYWPPWL